MFFALSILALMVIARAVMLLAALAVSACAEEPAPDLVEPEAEQVVADTTVEGDKLFPTQFAQVCRGTSGQPAAAVYDAEVGIHPFLTMTSGDGIEYQGTSVGRFPDGWRVSWPALRRAELVLCAHRVSETPVQVCEGYSDTDSGDEWSVQTYDAIYTYVVRNARTAEVVGTTKFEVAARPCPRFSFFRERSVQPQPSYPTPSDGEVELFMRPFVRGD